jgi:hypothetical protein
VLLQVEELLPLVVEVKRSAIRAGAKELGHLAAAAPNEVALSRFDPRLPKVRRLQAELRRCAAWSG